MPNKKSDTNNTFHELISPSVFETIVHQIDAYEVPTEFIERVVVYYANGEIIELWGSELTQPVPVYRAHTIRDMDRDKDMKEVKVYIDTARLEHVINDLVESHLGAYC